MDNQNQHPMEVTPESHKQEEQNQTRSFFTSRASIVNLFAILCVVLIIPLTLILSQQKQDLRGRAESNKSSSQGNSTDRPGIGQISGYVYIDKNGDGLRNAGELPYEGATITVTQIKENNSKSQQNTSSQPNGFDVKTDKGGYFTYSFSNLTPDSVSFTVKLNLPPGYKTINTNPVYLRDLHKDAKEIIEYGLLALPSLIKTTCTPRPACLDATPRCLMAEPASGWCVVPTKTVTPTTKPSLAPTGKPSVVPTVKPSPTPQV